VGCFPIFYLADTDSTEIRAKACYVASKKRAIVMDFPWRKKNRYFKILKMSDQMKMTE